MEYYSVLRRNELSCHEKTRGNFKCKEVKEANLKKKSHKLYDSSHMTFWKRQNSEDTKKISDFRIMGCGRDEQVDHRESLGQQNTLYDYTTMDKYVVQHKE